MKIKITEIEASADELRASNSVTDGILNILRKCFNSGYDLQEGDVDMVEDGDEKG